MLYLYYKKIRNNDNWQTIYKTLQPLFNNWEAFDVNKPCAVVSVLDARFYELPLDEFKYIVQPKISVNVVGFDG